MPTLHCAPSPNVSCINHTSSHPLHDSPAHRIHASRPLPSLPECSRTGHAPTSSCRLEVRPTRSMAAARVKSLAREDIGCRVCETRLRGSMGVCRVAGHGGVLADVAHLLHAFIGAVAEPSCISEPGHFGFTAAAAAAVGRREARPPQIAIARHVLTKTIQLPFSIHYPLITASPRTRCKGSKPEFGEDHGWAFGLRELV